MWHCHVAITSLHTVNALWYQSLLNSAWPLNWGFTTHGLSHCYPDASSNICMFCESHAFIFRKHIKEEVVWFLGAVCDFTMSSSVGFKLSPWITGRVLLHLEENSLYRGSQVFVNTHLEMICLDSLMPLLNISYTWSLSRVIILVNL